MSPEAAIRAAVTPIAFEAVRARAPEGVEVVTLGDGVALDTIDFLVPTTDQKVLTALPDLERLAVVQVLSAGTDWIEARMPPQAVLCSASGARDGPVAEWVLGALLGASTGLLECARRREWSARHLADLGGWTVLVVGMGSIGHAVQARLRGFGTEIVGVGSHTHGDLHGVDELPALLPRADAVVVLTPLTDATRGLIGAAQLAAMSDGAVLINAARGAVVDAEALLAEVRTGRLRAVLDVTDPEPLPDEHPLWSAPGLLAISPHVAGDSPAGEARSNQFAGDQLARWCAGRPLHNVVRVGLA